MTDLKEVSEKRVQKKIREKLESEVGGFWFKSVGGKFQTSGIPDLIGCVKGYYIAIEVKRPSKVTNVSELQKSKIEEINTAGGYAFVSCEREDAVNKVKEYLNSKGVEL